MTSKVPAFNLQPCLFQVYHAMDVTLCTSSILHLCCISVDRYYAIVDRPLLYNDRVTTSKCAVAVLGCWVLAGTNNTLILEIHQAAMLWLSLFSGIAIFLPISFTKNSQQRSTSDSDCKLLIAPINLKAMPAMPTAALLETFEEVPIAYDFSII